MLAEEAYIEVKQLHSLVNLARIANIYAMLTEPTCPFRNNPEVARLGFCWGIKIKSAAPTIEYRLH